MKNIDFTILNLDGKDYELKLSYKAIKRLKAKFGISFEELDDGDIETLAKVLFCATKENDLTFEQFEDAIDEYRITDLTKVIEDLMSESKPESKESKEIEEKEEVKK